MLGRIEAPAPWSHAEEVDDALRQPLLSIGRKRSAEEGVVYVVVPELGDQRQELGRHLGEDRLHLCARHLRLEVVEKDVVRLVARLETLDVAPAQRDVAREGRK